MSKRSRLPDAERTGAMVELVRGLYPTGENAMSWSHIVIEQVAPGTGWSTRRWADVLALCVWPSRGAGLDGFEIKASRADLKRELADPEKHRALARYCDRWFLVAWDEDVLTEGIPAEWGIYVTVEAEGVRSLKLRRKATRRRPEPWPREFVCSLVRNAFEQSPGAEFLARVAAASHARGLFSGTREAEQKADRLLEPLRDAIFGLDRWRRPLEARDPEKVIAAAVARLAQGVLSMEA